MYGCTLALCWLGQRSKQQNKKANNKKKSVILHPLPEEVASGCTHFLIDEPIEDFIEEKPIVDSVDLFPSLYVK